MNHDRPYHRKHSLHGYTLVELIVSMSAASMLMAGMLGSIFIVSRAFDGSDVQRETNQTADVLSEVMADVRHATSFSERTANALTFKVPDRDGDSLPETVRYAWSGTPGDPLTYEYNGGVSTTIAENVQQFNLTCLTRYMAAPVIPPSGGGGSSLLFVFGGSGVPSAQEELRIGLIESWGYAVTPISDTDPQANFDVALAGADVTYVSSLVSSLALGNKLTTATIGIVNESMPMGEAFGFDVGFSTKSRDELRVLDNSHYITSSFSTGYMPIFTSLQTVYLANHGTGQDGDALILADVFNTGDDSQNKPSLMTLSPGDAFESLGGTAAGRRVQLPWGDSSFDVTSLNTDGQAIMQRSIEWAAGSGGGSSEGILGYDTQFASTTSGVNGRQVGTQVVMPENGTLTSITAYIDPGGGGKDYRFAIYTDNAGEPGNLIVETAVDNQSETGWKTIVVTPTPLTAGTYWLALSFSHGGQVYYHTDTGGNTRHKLHNAVGNGFISVWPGLTTPYTHKVSIYGTYTVTP